MSIGSAFQWIDYYDVVFFVVIFLQEHVKDFLSTLMCFLMSYLSMLVVPYLMITYGYDFYMAAMFYEALFFFLSVFLVGSKVGVILCITTGAGFFVNFIGYLVPNGDFYQWYRSSYGALNLILFEVLVWACIANSRLKPLIEKINLKITTFLNKNSRRKECLTEE